MVLTTKENISHVCYYMAGMPVTVGAIRKLRSDKKRTQTNLRVKNSVRDVVAKMRRKPTEANLKAVFTNVDRAARKNVITKNKAARLKSRLSKLLSKKKRS